jgi:lysozyme
MKIRLVKNWRQIAFKSHSMRATWAGLAVLLLPEIWFRLAGFDLVSPYLTGSVGVSLLVYGAMGRLIDQGIGDA